MKRHRGFAALLVCAAILFTSDVWAYQEFVRAESYFALGARLMVEQGEWLTPHASDEQVLNKPPLTYWLIGTSYKAFGPSYGAARLPSVIAAMLVLLLVYAAAAFTYRAFTGLIASAILATSFLFLSFARMAMSDMLLTLFVTASILCFSIALKSDAKRRVVWLGYASLALGVLTKGPVAAALVIAPIALELLLSRRRDDLKKLRLVSGSILFAILALPYFVFVYFRGGANSLWFFFVGENLQRFTGQVYGALARPFWFELVAFFGDFAPWSILIFVAIWVDWKQRARADRLTRILYLWLGSTTLLFSLSSFKLDYYLLPAMPAAALLIARLFVKEDSPRVIWALRIFLIMGCLAVVASALIAIRASLVFGVTSSFRWLPAVVAIAGAAAIATFVGRKKPARAALLLSVTIGTTFLAAEYTLLPVFSNYLIASKLVAAAPDRVWIVSIAASAWADDLAFNLPAPHRIERAGREEFAKILQSDMHAVLLVNEREMGVVLQNDPSLKILATAETYGHGGITIKMLRRPQRERFYLIGRDP